MTRRDDMSDEQVRAELEWIHPTLPFLAELLGHGNHDDKCLVIMVLRLLAASQQALGEIAETPHAENCKTESMIKPSADDCNCHVSIARKHWKGGKS